MVRNRRGTVLPLLALTVTLLFAFVALAVDVGVLTIARTEAQNGCDASALAGARVLNNRPTATDNDKSDAIKVAENTVLQNINVFVQQNKKYNVLDNMSNFSDGGAAITVGQYNYNPVTQRFDTSFPSSSGGTSWTAVKVRLRGAHPTFFAKVVGISEMPWETYAVAAHRPRDIAIILDFSGSMGFSSQFMWEGGWSGSTVYGSMNPDEIYPQFGHYWRYTQYSRTAVLNSTNAGSATVGSRPNPLSTTKPYDLGANGLQAPSNYTVETPGGPPIVLDFRFDPANLANPAVPITTPVPANFWNAFNRWMTTTPAVENLFLDPSFRPSVVNTTNMGTYVQRTFNWSSYNAFDTTNQYGPTPAPDSFKDQADADATYVGDRFPRKGGQRFTSATTWDPTTVTGAARHVRDLLSLATAGNTSLIAATTRTTAPSTVPSGYTFPSAGDGGTAWDRYRDDLWENYGYDLNVAKYSGTNPNSTNRTVAEIYTNNSDKFKGYSMGPGYYGKTFFIWPPDPRFDNNADVTAPATTGSPAFDTSNRPMCDWRRRFFYKSGTGITETTISGRFNPQTDNDATTTGIQSINQVLLNTSTGRTLNTTTSKYKVNYRAVLAWLKSGPQVLPPNLRAGRILYYNSIPNDVDDLTNLDKRFWRDYIDYVLGYTGNVGAYNPTNQLAGNETKAWPEGGAVSISATAQQGSNPLPYMSYTDVPSMPRLHFWFGPLTMLGFISDRGGQYGWLAGTVHQTQCWQLKAGMNSALDDIKNNHPNDYCSLCYFANYNFQTPRVTMGQNWNRLKNALFYPYSLLPAIEGGDTTTELRPYTSTLSNALVGNLPNANGGTDPVSGFAQAFNTLSWSTSVYNARTSPNNTSANGGSGRRGAAKIVIYETDGVPNGRPPWTYMNPGTANAYWREGGSSPGSSAADDSIQVVKKMMLQQGSGGFSLPNASCKVHCLAFGDLFTTPYTTAAQNGLLYLLNMQKEGGTSPTSASAYTDFPPGKIIAGSYQNRITNLRTALEQILQSGIQVTLVE
jgi:Flp pilus assembly protein TadG